MYLQDTKVSITRQSIWYTKICCCCRRQVEKTTWWHLSSAVTEEKATGKGRREEGEKRREEGGKRREEGEGRRKKEGEGSGNREQGSGNWRVEIRFQSAEDVNQKLSRVTRSIEEGERGWSGGQRSRQQRTETRQILIRI